MFGLGAKTRVAHVECSWASVGQHAAKKTTKTTLDLLYKVRQHVDVWSRHISASASALPGASEDSAASFCAGTWPYDHRHPSFCTACRNAMD